MISSQIHVFTKRLEARLPAIFKAQDEALAELISGYQRIWEEGETATTRSFPSFSAVEMAPTSNASPATPAIASAPTNPSPPSPATPAIASAPTNLPPPSPATPAIASAPTNLSPPSPAEMAPTLNASPATPAIAPAPTNLLAPNDEEMGPTPNVSRLATPTSASPNAITITPLRKLQEVVRLGSLTYLVEQEVPLSTTQDVWGSFAQQCAKVVAEQVKGKQLQAEQFILNLDESERKVDIQTVDSSKTSKPFASLKDTSPETKTLWDFHDKLHKKTISSPFLEMWKNHPTLSAHAPSIGPLPPEVLRKPERVFGDMFTKLSSEAQSEIGVCRTIESVYEPEIQASTFESDAERKGFKKITSREGLPLYKSTVKDPQPTFPLLEITPDSQDLFTRPLTEKLEIKEGQATQANLEGKFQTCQLDKAPSALAIQVNRDATTSTTPSSILKPSLPYNEDTFYQINSFCKQEGERLISYLVGNNNDFYCFDERGKIDITQDELYRNLPFATFALYEKSSTSERISS
jgi:hypothetical protein